MEFWKPEARRYLALRREHQAQISDEPNPPALCVGSVGETGEAVDVEWPTLEIKSGGQNPRRRRKERAKAQDGTSPSNDTSGEAVRQISQSRSENCGAVNLSGRTCLSVEL